MFFTVCAANGRVLYHTRAFEKAVAFARTYSTQHPAGCWIEQRLCEAALPEVIGTFLDGKRVRT